MQKSNERPNFPQKTREEIKAEREAKKAAKAAAKIIKINNNKVDNKNADPMANCKISARTEKTIIATEKNDKENTSQPSGIGIRNDTFEGKNERKSKAELRAERRAKQEAQRAVKQQQQLSKDNVKSKELLKSHIETVSECLVKKNIVKEDAHEVNLFKHLYKERELSSFNVATVNSNIHPVIVKLGVQYANKIIVGSNARCLALLSAIKQVIQDFEKPVQADFIRGLETALQKSMAYLHHCRPLAVSMQNAMRYLKWQMTQLSSTLSDEDAKNRLQGIIDIYILEQIQLADKAISITIQTKISNGNVILTYGYSSLIQKILVDAHGSGKQFRVIVVDGRPWLEGKEQLRRLVKHGIECSYILINALSFIMPEVSKVFLGAHAILANGAVMSRVGTAQVALIARAFNVPVLVACETHKSSERVQTDSIVYNELGNADDLVNYQSNDNSKKSVLSNWRTKKSLNLLNITYDVTPADLVTAVVTELAILPCTSVPVILRIKPSEI
ncbi:hypothetical protein P5V15_014422 [Pogonomyrmex californicus]